MKVTSPYPSINSPPQRLLIVRLGSMGDIIHTLPAAFALRLALPDATMGWVIEERWAELLCACSEPRSGPRSPRRPLVDKLHVVDTRTWRKDWFSTHTWERVGAALSDLRAPRYDAAVDFQGAVRSAFLARCSGASTIYGFRQPRENVASMMYTRSVIAQGSHIVEQNLSLAAAVIGQPVDMRNLEFPCDEGAEKRCAVWLQSQSIGNFIVMNPGAGWGAKQWPPERYGAIARCLAQDGLSVLVNCGPGEEKLAQEVERESGGSVRAVSWPIPELIALTRRARLFIGGDTGPMHLAAALGIPVVAIFGPTNPARNGPLGTRSIVLRSSSSTTSHSRRSAPDPGLLEIDVDDVVAAARKLLEQGHG
jgi:lipopolysaccharide heptosyltransferase I